MPELREYQKAATEKVMEALRVHNRVILQAPTGSGKTVMAVDLVEQLPKPVLFLAHSREIVRQSHRTLQSMGLDCDLLVAETRTGKPKRGRLFWNSLAESEKPVTVASQMTAWSRGSKGHKLPSFRAIIADEAHHARARTWTEIFDLWPWAKVVGLTATPCRGDGKGMGSLADDGKPLFQEIISAANYSFLIDNGFLVDAPPDFVYTWPVDLKGVKTSMGDFQMGGKKGASKLMDTVERVGDCVTHWQELAEGRPTIVYASSVPHAQNIRDRFAAEGIAAECVIGEMPKDERDEITSRLGKGIDVVTNFGCLTEGFDCPEVSCVILERPTKIFGLYLQMVGRGLRPAPGKTELMILDHAGCVIRHGLPTADCEWVLDEGRQAAKREGEDVSGVSNGKPKVVFCPKCHVVIKAPPCKCGWAPAVPKERTDRFLATGKLVSLSERQAEKIVDVFGDPKRKEYLNLQKRAQKNGYKPGYAGAKFKEKYGEWPPLLWNLPDPREVDPEEFAEAAVAYAKERGFKEGWAAVQYKEVYGKWPKKELMQGLLPFEGSGESNGKESGKATN